MRKPKGIATLSVVSLLISACSVSVTKISLKTPDAVKYPLIVVANDTRMDKQIYMMGIGWTSETFIYPLTAEPSIESVIERHVLSALSSSPSLPLKKIEINIEELDLKNKIGLSTNDELYCKIESSIVALNSTTKPLEQQVKTLSKNTENLSPFIASAGKVILDQCLEQHALEIVDKVTTSLQN